jgi:Uma2 family endonuclease
MQTIIDDKPHWEIIDGQRHRKVSPRRSHSRVQWALGQAIQRCGRDVGEIDPEIRVYLEPGTQLVPDLGFFSFSRLQSLPNEDAEKPPFAPDIAVEVRSPKDSTTVLRTKIERYLRYGSGLVLVADPAKQTLEAHTARGAEEYKMGEHFESLEFPWLSFDVTEIFAAVRIPPATTE